MDKLEELRSALFQVTPDEVKEQERVENQVGIIAQEVSDIASIPTITLSSLSSLDIASLSIGSSMNTGSSGASGSWTTINTSPSPTYTFSAPNINTITGSSSTPGLHVTSDAEFDGDIKWKGRSLGTMLETIEARLSILQPDPAKLEKFEALKKAYDHYKLMEKLCHDDPKPTE
jgi:hypothetical protein